MKNKKTSDVEDAKVVVSENLKAKNVSVRNFTTRIITLGSIFFILFLSAVGMASYQFKKLSTQILQFQNEIELISAEASIENIRKQLNELELSIRRENTNKINEGLSEIEISLNKNIRSKNNDDFKRLIGDINTTNNTIAKIRLQFENDIKELRVLLEKTETNKTVVISNEEVKNQFDFFKASISNRLDFFENKLEKLSQGYLLSERKLRNLDQSISDSFNKKVILDITALTALEQSFPEIAYYALKMEAQKGSSGSIWSNIFTTVKSFFVFRSTTPQDGSDTNSILSRAEFHLSRGDFKSCLQELDSLEESTADLFSDWKKKLKDLIEETN